MSESDSNDLPPAARVWLDLAVKSMNASLNGERDKATRLADLAHSIANEFFDEIKLAKTKLGLSS